MKTELEQLIVRLNNRDGTALNDLLTYMLQNKPLSFRLSDLKDIVEKKKIHSDNFSYVVRYVLNACPKCACTESSVKNYNEMWRDGDVYCNRCNEYIRMYDAG